MTRRAFTLVEVLLAVFIIGLGSIGLFALFAGVASQQSRASELSRSVAQSQGLLGTLEGRVGALTDWHDAFGEPVNDPVFRAPLVRGVWYPAFSYYNQDSPSLSINPRGRQNITLGRYFVTPPVEREVYANPAVGQGTTFGPESGTGVGVTLWSGGAFAGYNIASLPFTRAALGTLRVEFWTTSTISGRQRLAWAVDDSELAASLTHPELFNESERILPPSAIAGDPQIRFNYVEDIDFEGAGPDELARLVSFDLTGLVSANEWVSSIRVRCGRRADAILGPTERVVTTPDPDRESGRRAISGATALYRITPTGRSQYVSLTYAILPLDRVGDYVPPENPSGSGPNATHGLLRISNDYSIKFDDGAGEYFLTWVAPDDELRPGDILIVGGELNPDVGAPIDDLGADNPVRFSRVVTRSGETRAYLADAPRVGGRPMVGRLTGANVQLSRVYSLRREVECTDPYGVTSRWELRPVLYQTLDVK